MVIILEWQDSGDIFFPLFSVSTMHTVGRDRAGTRGLSGTYTSSEEPLYLFQIFITRKILWQMD